MNLTSVVLGYVIESVASVAIGKAIMMVSDATMPMWAVENEPLIFTLMFAYALAHAVMIVVALRRDAAGAPVPSPRLPNLAQTASRMAFPEPPTHRARRTTYSARQRRAVRP